MLQKIIYAATANSSYRLGSQALTRLAGLEVSPKDVERVADRIGKERCEERKAEVEVFQAMPLVERKAVPAGVVPPAVAVVGVDGGRLQIWERGESPSESAEEAVEPDDGQTGKHWREDKIGVVLQMTSEVSVTDPCPKVPETFVDPTKILRLARELKTKTAPREDGLEEPPAEEEEVERTYDWKPPEVTHRTLVASRCRWLEFGPKMAEAAWSQGFFGAERRAFIGDGSENNWTVWRNHFSSFEPILDFIHSLSYVFASAMAGRSFQEGWKCYVRWIGWVWQGEVERVIVELAARQTELGTPSKDESETSPRNVVGRALTYLQNHKSKMRYGDYRRQGLPIMSSYVESAVKQFNFRVKGTEKLWSEIGAEGMLQLRADELSENQPLIDFWFRRENKTTGQRSYQTAA